MAPLNRQLEYEQDMNGQKVTLLSGATKHYKQVISWHLQWTVQTKSFWKEYF